MTLLDIVNKVMIRMREDTVTSLDQTMYSSLVGAFVYDAMKTVEDAWQFSGLRAEEQLVTIPSQHKYPLTSLDNYDIILNVFNEATQQNLVEISTSDMKYRIRRGADVTSAIRYWAWYDTDGTDKQIAIYPAPTASDILDIDWVRKTSPEYTGDTILRVPSQPVIYLAFAHTIRERGEVGGQSAAEVYALADAALNDAVAHDADMYPTETLYRAV